MTWTSVELGKPVGEEESDDDRTPLNPLTERSGPSFAHKPIAVPRGRVPETFILDVRPVLAGYGGAKLFEGVNLPDDQREEAQPGDLIVGGQLLDAELDIEGWLDQNGALPPQLYLDGASAAEDHIPFPPGLYAIVAPGGRGKTPTAKTIAVMLTNAGVPTTTLARWEPGRVTPSWSPIGRRQLYQATTVPGSAVVVDSLSSDALLDIGAAGSFGYPRGAYLNAGALDRAMVGRQAWLFVVINPIVPLTAPQGGESPADLVLRQYSDVLSGTIRVVDAQESTKRITIGLRIRALNNRAETLITLNSEGI